MSYRLRQPPLDLFGEVVITEDDLYNWVAAVAPVYLTDRSYRNYVRSWDVAGKVRTSKLRGEFDARTARPRPAYHARLALHSIM